MNRSRTLIASAVVAMLLGGCSAKGSEPFRDAPRAGRSNDDPAEVINMPDGFSNLATKCDGHGNRVYVAFKANANRAAIAAIRDPSCSAGRR